MPPLTSMTWLPQASAEMSRRLAGRCPCGMDAGSIVQSTVLALTRVTAVAGDAVDVSSPGVSEAARIGWLKVTMIVGRRLDQRTRRPGWCW